MSNATVTYLEENYLTTSQLLERSEVDREWFEEWVSWRCLPTYSYRLDTRGRVHSFFGIHDTASGISSSPVDQMFYNGAHVGKIRMLKALDEQPSNGLSERLKGEFDNAYVQALRELEVHRFGMASYIDATGATGDDCQALIDSEWNYYLDGTYGLCTKTASVEEIATKEAMIRKINYLTDDMKMTELNEQERRELTIATDMLDSVSSQFAPHERPLSSRFRYIDQVRERYRL